MDFSLVAASRGYSLVVCGLLISEVSLIAEQMHWSVWALAVVAPRL